MLARLVERKGGRIHSTSGEGSDDDGPTSMLMRHIIDAFAEYERALIRSRTKAALAVKKARGERVGGIPFGYALGSRWARAGRATRGAADARRPAGILAAGYTLRGTAAELNRRGFRTRCGSARVHQYVANQGPLKAPLDGVVPGPGPAPDGAQETV